jgi:hypothetical protein
MGNDRTPPVHRTTVAEAARLLGISAEAVRGRIRRGTLPVEREEGTVYVLLDVPAEDRTDADQPGDQTRTTGDRPQSEPTALISELRDRVESLERQLEAERQANSEHRRLLAAALERIPPAIEPPAEAPPDERDAPETASTAGDAGPPRSDAPGPQEGARRSWWRRVFGR